MKYLLIILIILTSIYGEPASKNDIRLLIEQMDKRFDVMQANMDKRFEQVDKRFEAVDRRFETVFNLMYILMGLVFASPFIAIYLRDKKEAEYKKNFDIVKGMLFALREFAQDNEKIAKSLRAANLL